MSKEISNENDVSDEALTCLQRMHDAPNMTRIAAFHKIRAVQRFKNARETKKPLLQRIAAFINKLLPII